MTAQRYREIREEIGTQDLVAKRLGIDKRTIQRRENGAMKVDREAEVSIRFLLLAKIFRIGPGLILLLNGLDFLL